MPSLEHEAPLVVLREEPSLVPRLLRDALGLVLPAFATVEVADPTFTQAQPAELRADLVVVLRSGPPEDRPVMGIVLELQRARDDDKVRSWPLYVASLHARLGCQTCLVVVATNEATARWAATPITTVQLGSPFVPLVLGPGKIPRLSPEQARREPWLAVLSVLVHGNRADGAGTVRAVAAALAVLPERPASVCYDLVRASLDEVARRVLEEEMESGKYEYKSDFARRYFGEGREAGRQEGRQEGGLEVARNLVIALAGRHGPVRGELRARVVAADDLERLRALALELAGAADSEATEALLARLPSPSDRG